MYTKSKSKNGAKAGKYKFRARASKCKLGARARARAEGQAKGWWSGNTNTLWKHRFSSIFHKDQTNFQKQLKLKVAVVFLENCHGQIMIDHDQIMNNLTSLLVLFHRFSHFWSKKHLFFKTTFDGWVYLMLTAKNL